LLYRVADGHAAQTAFVESIDRLSYGALHERARSIAAALVGSGTHRGDRVGLLLPNTRLFVEALHGVLAAGAVAVPVNPGYSADELTFVLAQSGSSTLIVVDDDAMALLGETCPEVNISESGQFEWARLPLLRRVFRLTDLDVDAGLVVAAELDALRDSIHERELAIIQYTSGTTSFPKGVMLTHRNILHGAWALTRATELTQDDRVFCAQPFFHIGGTVFLLCQTLMAAATGYTMRHWNTEQALRVLASEKITIMLGMGEMVRQLLDHPDFADFDISSLRQVFASGSRIVPAGPRRGPTRTVDRSPVRSSGSWIRSAVSRFRPGASARSGSEDRV
jgi:fatty-acyl-CoA synthase